LLGALELMDWQAKIANPKSRIDLTPVLCPEQILRMRGLILFLYCIALRYE
jgi:hypothetical protein